MLEGKAVYLCNLRLGLFSWFLDWALSRVSRKALSRQLAIRKCHNLDFSASTFLRVIPVNGNFLGNINPEYKYSQYDQDCMIYIDSVNFVPQQEVILRYISQSLADMTTQLGCTTIVWLVGIT